MALAWVHSNYFNMKLQLFLSSLNLRRYCHAIIWFRLFLAFHLPSRCRSLNEWPGDWVSGCGAERRYHSPFNSSRSRSCCNWPSSMCATLILKIHLANKNLQPLFLVFVHVRFDIRRPIYDLVCPPTDRLNECEMGKVGGFMPYNVCCQSKSQYSENVYRDWLIWWEAVGGMGYWAESTKQQNLCLNSVE